MTGDEVTLTLPRERTFHRVAELVFGGLAARHDVTLEVLEDLQLAVAGILDRLDGDGSAVLRLSIVGDEARAVIGPLDERLRTELARRAGDDLDLPRLLDTVVDRYELIARDEAQWVRLTKAVR
jgi:hypothetical protein